MTTTKPRSSFLPVMLIIVGWVFVFRFMFASGISKLLSRCPAWRNLTALRYHYETQPLPNRLAWWAHQQPLWAHKAATAATLFLEIPVPFLIFAPADIRIWAFWAFIALMATIHA